LSSTVTMRIIARSLAEDRIPTGGPHFRKGVRRKQDFLSFGRKLEILAALDRHNLLTAGIALGPRLPDELVAVPFPAALVNLDGDPLPHEMIEQQGEGQADRPAAGDRDAQDRRIRNLHDRFVARENRLRFDSLEAEGFVANDDLVSGLELVNCDRIAVDPSAVAATEIVKNVTAILSTHFGMVTRRDLAGEHHHIVFIASESQRGLPDRKTLTHQRTLQSDKHWRRHAGTFRLFRR